MRSHILSYNAEFKIDVAGSISNQMLISLIEKSLGGGSDNRGFIGKLLDRKEKAELQKQEKENLRSVLSHLSLKPDGGTVLVSMEDPSRINHDLLNLNSTLGAVRDSIQNGVLITDKYDMKKIAVNDISVTRNFFEKIIEKISFISHYKSSF